MASSIRPAVSMSLAESTTLATIDARSVSKTNKFLEILVII
jgi:hypothetical protein